MNLDNFNALFLVIAPIVIFVVNTIKSQIDNVAKRNWQGIMLFVITVCLTTLIIIYIKEYKLIQIELLNNMSIENAIGVGIGLGFAIGGGYDTAKGAFNQILYTKFIAGVNNTNAVVGGNDIIAIDSSEFNDDIEVIDEEVIDNEEGVI
ncbi:hypothetical protein [Mycoplasma sp. P36-A1]|uniref:hypothetical protein n=1 Tax=Mycoplasma sp. P36-A1 TaxID=3252900 RepID=UPI003C2D7873